MRRLSSGPLRAEALAEDFNLGPPWDPAVPVRQPMVVLLPDPFGPRKPKHGAGPFTVSESPSTATTPSYFFTRFEIRIASVWVSMG